MATAGAAESSDRMCEQLARAAPEPRTVRAAWMCGYLKDLSEVRKMKTAATFHF
jgi:hypothetical protein